MASKLLKTRQFLWGPGWGPMFYFRPQVSECPRLRRIQLSKQMTSFAKACPALQGQRRTGQSAEEGGAAAAQARWSRHGAPVSLLTAYARHPGGIVQTRCNWACEWSPQRLRLQTRGATTSQADCAMDGHILLLSVMPSCPRSPRGGSGGSSMALPAPGQPRPGSCRDLGSAHMRTPLLCLQLKQKTVEK